MQLRQTSRYRQSTGQLGIAYLHISTSSGEQDVVRVPVEAENGAADRLFDVLAHPPVIVLLKVTDADATRSGRDSKLVLFW